MSFFSKIIRYNKFIIRIYFEAENPGGNTIMQLLLPGLVKQKCNVYGQIDI